MENIKEPQTHEEAVIRCNAQIKSIIARGWSVHAVSWFDDTHYHINFTPMSELEEKTASQATIYKIKQLIEERELEKENGKR